MDQDELRDSIDELYAIQKQAGDRMVELTQENQFTLEKLERIVMVQTGKLVEYSKIYLGMLVVANVLGVLVLLWLFNSFNNEFKNQLARVELAADASIIIARDCLKELQKAKNK